MSILLTLWWLLFWAAVGLCLGSFLNVVIYRLPRDRSIRVPLWSACPYCSHRIRWYDNLPLVSFIMLRGRCRECGSTISTRYFVVEAGMALIVLMLLDAFFIAHVRAGLAERPLALAAHLQLAEQLALDWPILMSHIILFGCLLSMSAIDLEHYWVDVRFTNFATLAGFVLHALWTPRYSAAWIRPFDTTAVVCFLMLSGVAIVWIVLVCQPHVDPEDYGEVEAEEFAESIPRPQGDTEPRRDREEACDATFRAGGFGPCERPPQEAPSRLFAWLTGLFLVGLIVSLLAVEGGGLRLTHLPRALLPLLLFFLLIVRENRVVRESDQRIEEELEEERPGARRMALTELGLLLPAILLGVAGYWILSTGGQAAAERISDLLHARTRVWSVSALRNWQPLYGLATAASGFVIAGALGWTVRIVFTLIFGKEALGVGDIHLLAAAGCVAGWPVAVLGFFLTCAVAIVGWLLSRKQSRALPLGPWLAFSFLIVVIFYDSITQWPMVARFSELPEMLFF